MPKVHNLFVVTCLVVFVGSLLHFPVNRVFPRSLEAEKVLFRTAIELKSSLNNNGLVAKRPSEIYVAGKTISHVITLPDNKVLIPASLRGRVWTLANQSQVLGKAKSPAPPNITDDKTSYLSTCTGCGLDGWGECRNGTCLCPVFYNTADCLTAIDIPRNRILERVDSLFMGEVIMSRLYVSGLRKIATFVPDDVADSNQARKILGAVDQRLLSALPARDRLRAGRVFQSCAVVGSSGLLARYSLGEEIDKHEAVIRFDSDPTLGFERSVGSRTTMRFTSAAHWGSFETAEESVVVPLRSRGDLEALADAVKQLSSAKFMALNPDFLSYVGHCFEFAPSMRLTGLLLSLQRCARVTAYGFHSPMDGNVSYLYYDRCMRPPSWGLDLRVARREHQVVASLAALGLLQVGPPCAADCPNAAAAAAAACASCQAEHSPAAVVGRQAAASGECPACSRSLHGCPLPAPSGSFARRVRAKLAALRREASRAGSV